MAKGLSIFSVMSILLVLWGNSSFVPSVKNIGFYCNDTSIQKPYHGDSIRTGTLFSSLILGGAIIIFITEKLNKSNSGDSTFKAYFKYFFSGFCCTLGFTEILKLSFGELRPHFISTCQPNIYPGNCSGNFVTDFVCTGDGPSWLVHHDIYKSFPSGHASLSCYVFAFLSVHAHFRIILKSAFNAIWKHLMPLICFAWALTCCISRILDNRHFWWDVLAGITIGLVGGFLMITSAEKTLSSRAKVKEQKTS